MRISWRGLVKARGIELGQGRRRGIESARLSPGAGNSEFVTTHFYEQVLNKARKLRRLDSYIYLKLLRKWSLEVFINTNAQPDWTATSELNPAGIICMLVTMPE